MVQSKLLDVAVREFGLKGLEGASTRGIAAAAGTAMSSITYHYGGKEGLYLAAAEHIAQHMADPDLARLIEEAIASDDATVARAALKTVLDRLADKLMNPASDDWTLFIMREQVAPTAAFDRIYDGPMGRMLEAMVQLVCIASGHHDNDSARLVAVTLVGQVLIGKSARAMVHRLLARDHIDQCWIATLKARVSANTDAILDRLVAEQREQA